MCNKLHKKYPPKDIEILDNFTILFFNFTIAQLPCSSVGRAYDC